MTDETPLRALARAFIRPGALMRIDRGDALYVTDDLSAAPALTRAGFTAAPRGALMAIGVTEALLPVIAASLPCAPNDRLTAQLDRLAGRPVTAGEITLLTRALKVREPGGPPWPDADKRLRQMTALCLRTGGGGALPVIARLLRYEED